MSKDGKELSSDISNITSKVEKKEEVKKESLILKYDGFRKINEAVDYDAIASKFNDLFTEDIQDKFQFTETQVQDIKDMGKTTDNIVLRNSDSIMEIVRLFQRAWRLHTVPTIPSGRTGGKVSMCVYLEYDTYMQAILERSWTEKELIDYLTYTTRHTIGLPIS